MNRREHKTFMARTRNSFASHRRRAQDAGQELDYTLDHLRQHVAWHLEKPCTYCGKPMTAKTFSVDHRNPVKRGGQFTWDNLQIIDTRCNQIKGTMNDAEYAAFLIRLQAFPEEISKNIMARMRAGAAIIRC